MTSPIDRLFREPLALAGTWIRGADCPDDTSMAAFLDQALDATARRGVEDHLLACPTCLAVSRIVTEAGLPALEVAPTLAHATAQIVARFVRQGLELVDAVGARLLDPPLDPALGPLRRSSEHPTVVPLEGPGSGLDTLTLTVEPSGTVQLCVRSEDGPATRSGEVASIVFERDGAAREKRPFDGSELAFGPLGPGRYAVRLVARAPGQPVRTLAETTLSLES